MRTLNHLSFCSSLALALSLTRTVSSQFTFYTRALSVVGSDFFEQFNWESENDPTHGRVNYLTLEEARAKNLSYGESSISWLALHRYRADGRDQSRVTSSSCYRTLRTSSTRLLVGEIASGSVPNRPLTNPSSSSTSNICPTDVLLGQPFGRCLNRALGRPAERLISLRLRPSNMTSLLY